MSKTVKATLLSYFSVAFYIISGFFYTPFLIKSLGVSDYGIYSLYASLIGYFSIDFGIGAAQTRLTARYLAEGDVNKIRDMLGITAKLYLIIDAGILLLLALCYSNLPILFPKFDAIELEKFRKVFLIACIFILFNFPFLPTKGLYIAYEKVSTYIVIDLIYKVLSLVVLCTCLYMGKGLVFVVLLNCICSIIAQIIKLAYLALSEHLSYNFKANDSSIRKYILGFTAWASLAMIADKLFFGFIPFLLASLSNSREVAIFAIVSSLEGYVLTISRSLSGVFLPQVTRMVVANQSTEERTSSMIKVGRIQLFIVGLLIIGLISFGKQFITLWVGEDFEKSFYCAVIVLLPCLFHYTQTIAEEFIYATNSVKYIAFRNILGSLLCILCIVLLAPKYGAIAAAIGVACSFVFAHNLYIISAFFKECHFKVLPVLLVICIIGFSFNYILPSYDGWIALFVRIIIWVILSIILLWLLCFNKEEKAIIFNLKKRIND